MNSSNTLVTLEEAIGLVERDPLNLPFWKVLEALTAELDPLGTQSVKLVTDSLHALKSSRYSCSLALRKILFRLARSYNNPSLLRQAGLAVQELKLIEEGQRLIDHAGKLSGNREEERTSNKADSEPEKLGIVTHHARGKIARITFRKSGRCQLLRPNGDQKVVLHEDDLNTSRALPKSSDDCLRQASEAIRQKRSGTAYRLLSSINPAPSSIDSIWERWTDLGELYYESAFYQNACDCYEKAAALRPDLLISHFNRGTSLQMVGKEDEALEAYFRADKITPDHPKVWCNVGTVYFLKGAYSDSEHALKRSLAAKPHYARSWDNLACALGAQGKFGEAYWACCQCLATEPNYREAQLKLAVIYCQEERWAEAMPLLLETISHPTLHLYAYAYLSMSFAMLGNLLGARQAITSAKGVADDILAVAWSTLGQGYLNQGQLLECRAAYRQAVSLDPANGEHWLQLAGISHRLGDRIDSSECFQKAREFGGTFAEVA